MRERAARLAGPSAEVGTDGSPALSEVNVARPHSTEVGVYGQWVGHLQFAKRDGQLVGVVADFGHEAPRFDSDEKLILPAAISKYLDVGDFNPPLTPEGYAQFEFFPTRDSRRIWLQATRKGVVAIEVWRPWREVPWDWVLAEAYTSLLSLRDGRMRGLFQSRGITRATLTLGNLVVTDGTMADVRVTTQGQRLDLVPLGEEVPTDRSRVQSVRHECERPIKADPWECAKAFVKQTLTNTGAMRFEKRLEALDKEDFVGKYFEAPGSFRRPHFTSIGQ
jgi:hypothetical protein